MKEIKIFFLDVKTDESINGDHPIVVSFSQALNKFNQLSMEDGSFIGFEFTENRVIQFMYNESGSLYLDVIDPISKNTFGKKVDKSEANNIIQNVYRGNDPMNIRNLESDDNIEPKESGLIVDNFGIRTKLQFLSMPLISFTFFCVIFLIMWYIFQDWGNPFTNLSAFIHNFMFTCGIGIPLIAIIVLIKKRVRK
jgi:hypothetical protein